jgi:preprotein translocase subunit SecE
MAKITPIQFYQQVKQEVAKVTWPTRKETIVTSAMVFLMVIVTSLFFLLVDYILGTGVSYILGLGNGA